MEKQIAELSESLRAQETRLRRLEAVNRRLVRVLSLFSMLVVAAGIVTFLSAAKGSEDDFEAKFRSIKADLIATHKLAVIDQQGRVRGLFSVSDDRAEVGISLVTPDKRPVWEASVGNDGASTLIVSNRDGNAMATVSVGSDGLPLIGVSDSQKTRLTIGPAEDSENKKQVMGIAVTNPKGSATLGVTPEGMVSAVMKSGKSALTALVRKENASLTVTDGAALVAAGVHDGKAGVTAKDARGVQGLVSIEGQ